MTIFNSTTKSTYAIVATLLWGLTVAAPAMAEPASYLVEGAQSAQHVQAVGGTVENQMSALGMVTATLEAEQAAALRQQGLRVTADRSVHTSSLSNQAYPTPIPVETGASALHARGIYGTGVTIAFVDTGVWRMAATEFGISDKRTRLLAQYDATIPDANQKNNPPGQDIKDPSGHGTHVASIATSSLQNADTLTYEGIAPDANLVAVRAFAADGSGSYASVVNAINWVIVNKDKYNIRVMNLSFSADPESWYWEDPIDRAVMSAWQAGIVVVAAAGNRGPVPMSVGVPGNVPYVITIGAYTDSNTPQVASDPINRADDRLATFSSTGPTYEGFVKPDLIALGGHVVAEMMEGSDLWHTFQQYGQVTKTPHHFMMSGTSQSTAVVSGVVALMLQQDSSLTPDDVKCRLKASALQAQDVTGRPVYSVFQQGSGAVDAVGALSSSASGCANLGLDIDADLAGRMHFGGPANRDANGNFYLMNNSEAGSVWDGNSASNQSTLWVPPTKPKSATSQSTLWIPPTKPKVAGILGDAVDWTMGLWQGALVPDAFTWAQVSSVLVSGQISNHPFVVPQQ